MLFNPIKNTILVEIIQKMKNKRFQECNWVEKLWRYRWYTLIPFKWVWFMYIKPLVVRETELNEESGFVEDTGEIYNPRGKELWSILIGESQGKMNWVWTSEEVFGRIREKYKDE